MLLALDAFFFAPGAPVNPGPPAPDGPASNAGGGKHGGKHAYTPVSDEYWDAREKALRGDTATPAPAPKPGPTMDEVLADARSKQHAEFLQELNTLMLEREHLDTYRQMHAQAVASLRSAKDVDEMENIDATIAKIEEAATSLQKQHNQRLARATSLRKELAIS